MTWLWVRVGPAIHRLTSKKGPPVPGIGMAGLKAGSEWRLADVEERVEEARVEAVLGEGLAPG